MSFRGFPPNPFEPAPKEPECDGLKCKLSEGFKEYPPASCMYATCDRSFAIRVHLTMVMSFDDGGTYQPEGKGSIFVCPGHARLLAEAESKGLTIRITPEGFAWIDTTDYIRFDVL